MQWIAKICIERSVFTWVLMLTVCVVGTMAYAMLGLDQFPNVDIPVVTVLTRLDGYAPQEVETDITDKLENNLNTISGIDEMRSISSDGVSQISIMFDLEKDGDVAAQDVRDKVTNATRDLPRNIDPPNVIKLDPDSSPVMYLTVSSQGSIRDTTELADKTVKRSLQGVSGVGQVSLIGGRKREMRIWLDPLRLNALGLTARDVQMALQQQNISTPGGAIEGGAEERGLRIEGRVNRTQDLGALVVRQQGDHPLRVRDVARVEDGSEDEASWASHDGEQAVVLSVRKQSGSNTVAVVDRVKERVQELKSQLPPGAKLSIVRDNSEVIRTSVDAVIEHLVLGAFFAIVIVLIFLGSVKSTLVAALAIPISIVGTFALMWHQGFTLNTLTLLALALSVGIVIDDAIVVLENIHRFVHEKNMAPFEAARAATADIGLAVIATTLSLMAVFLPIAFMQGIVGRFLRSFGVTMACAVGVSMLVSFTLTPMLCARWIKKSEGNHGPSALERIVERFYNPIESLYMVALRWAMKHRGIMVLLCLATLGSSYPLAKSLSGSFLPPNDEAQLEMHVRAPEGTSLTETRLIIERIALATRGVDGVAYTVVTIGDDQQELRNKGTIYLKLTDPKDRDVSQQQIAARLREQVVSRQDSKLRIDVSDVSAFGGGESSAAVQFTISGPDLDRLKAITHEAVTKLKAFPGAVDVDSNLIDGKPEIQVHLERDRAADLGVSASDVAETLQLLVSGLKVSTFPENGESFDVRLRAEAKYRADAQGLGYIQVPNNQGGVVPLSEVTRIGDGFGPAQINRINRRRQVTLFANAAPGVGQSEVLGALNKIIDDMHLPPTYARSLQGQSKEMAKTGLGFAIAFATSFVFMYLVLAAQFESWAHPFTILVTLPLTVPFALLSLVVTHQPLSLFSALGLLVLFGVVKKNAILQVDHTNTLRAEGMDRAQAILQANKDRLRPILMTTIAFVAGMLPLIFSRGIGAGHNQATAGVVVGGQSLSLLLTLLATPVIYSLLDDGAQWLRRRRGIDESVAP
jgi:HAE1 family hydrophobic/amphiphilic exporter-1